MKDITQDFGKLYHPTSALVFFQTNERIKETYVEYFDMDKNGNPINAHPLTEKEAKTLVKALNTKTQKEKKSRFSKTKRNFTNPHSANQSKCVEWKCDLVHQINETTTLFY